MDWDDPNARGGSRRHLIQQCEASLKRLDVDHIDLYQIHAPDPRVPFDETLRALDDLVRSGKVRYIGSSSFAAWQLVETLWIAKEYGLNRIVTEQPRYNILARNIEREVVPVAQRHNIALLPYAPLQGGLLSGRYRRDEPHPEDSRMADPTWAEWAGGFMHDGVYDVVDVLQEMAAEKGCTITQLAIAWTMHRPAVASVIIGPRTMQHFEANLGALNVEITEEDNKRIDAIAPLRK
jgi:aryl-alcohol dehydrogenase-like predicted oxidoreductase